MKPDNTELAGVSLSLSDAMDPIAPTAAILASAGLPSPRIAKTTDQRCLANERVLILAPLGEDASAVRAVLDAEGLVTHVCSGLAECGREVAAGAGALVLAEEAMDLSHVSNLIGAFQEQAPWSELPVIILTCGGESRQNSLLSLAAAARGATLIERPISKDALVRSLEVALTSRRRQYHVRRLLEAQAQLAAIVTSSDDAIVSKTLEGIVTTWNAGAQRIFGYSAEEMIGQPILRLIPLELYHEESVILARLKKGERIEHYETVRVSKNGTRVPVSLTISPMRDESGNLIGASKIARDITERRAAEEKLRLAKEEAEAASHAKDSFLAALSHELRTPLTPVLMTAAALREDGRLPEDVRTQLGMIERNVVLEARLIDDLLDLSRIVHGKLSLRSEPCDVHSLICLAVEIVREEAGAKNMEITLDLASRNPGIIGDPARLEQVFWNLLRNAVKFTPPGGHIRIRSYDEARLGSADGEAKVCVVVSDDGIGLDPAAAERIFEPFQQDSSSQAASRGGLGLGLAIARGIIDLHHGAIRAESRGAGCGSAFTVELPAAGTPVHQAAAETGGIADPARNAPLPGNSLRLLVVDDDEPTLKVLVRFLERDGHQVVGAGNLSQALAAAAVQHFDAVISDLGLPDGTGAELMEELRGRYGMRGIVLSGYGMEEDLRRSREAGFSVHLVKPIDVNDLRRALRRICVEAADDGSDMTAKNGARTARST